MRWACPVDRPDQSGGDHDGIAGAHVQSDPGGHICIADPDTGADADTGVDTADTVARAVEANGRCL